MNEHKFTFPHRLRGKRANFWVGFLTLFFIPLLWNVFLVGLGWEAETLFGELVALLFIIANNLFGLYLAYTLIWKYTRFAVFKEDEIVVQWLIQKVRFKTADLQSIHIHTWKQTSKNRTFTRYGLMLTFMGEQPDYLLEKNHFSDPQLSLLPDLCQQYGLPYKPERNQADEPHRHYATGSERPLADYLEGESSVQVHNIDELISWLFTCKYGRDPEHYGHPDHWQLPGEFEQSKLGDCEDHAIWAWRKLVEMGIDAEFVVGRMNPTSDNNGAHAWVIYTQNGKKYLLESTSKNRKPIIKLLVHTLDSYFPHYSVNGRFAAFHYPHFILKHLSEKHLA